MTVFFFSLYSIRQMRNKNEKWFFLVLFNYIFESERRVQGSEKLEGKNSIFWPLQIQITHSIFVHFDLFQMYFIIIILVFCFHGYLRAREIEKKIGKIRINLILNLALNELKFRKFHKICFLLALQTCFVSAKKKIFSHTR